MHEKPKSDLESQPAPTFSPGALPPRGPTKPTTLAQKWNESIDPIYADYIGLLLCFVTGLCDSSAYNAWTCFLAMQTGTPPPCIQMRYKYASKAQRNANRE